MDKDIPSRKGRPIKKPGNKARVKKNKKPPLSAEATAHSHAMANAAVLLKRPIGRPFVL